MKISKLKSIFEYLFAFSLVMDCRSIWFYLSTAKSGWGYLVLALMIFSTLGILVCSRKHNRIDWIKAFETSLLVFIYISIFLLIQNMNRISTLKFLIATIIITFITNSVYEKDSPQILYKYRNIIVWIALVSTFFWFFGSFLNLIKPSGISYSSWTGNSSLGVVKNYYNIYFETQTSNLSGIISFVTRNSAIFVEAPMASLNFCIALAINELIDKKNNRFQFYARIILVISIFTTFSMTGYIFIVSLYLLIYINKNSGRRSTKILQFLIAVILVFCSFLFINKLISQKLTVDSGKIRLDDYIACFKAWLNHPFFGVGLTNDEAIYPYMASWRWSLKSFGLSNSFGTLLAEGGIYFFIFYLYAFSKSIYINIKYVNKNYLYFTVLIIYLFITTVFPYQYLLIMILIWMLQ